MAGTQQRCPICGTKLKPVNGRMTCGECGYYVRSNTTDYYSTDAYHTDADFQSAGSDPSGRTSADGSPSQQTVRPPAQSPVPAAASGSSGGHSQGASIAKQVVIVFAVLVAVNIIGGAIAAYNVFRDGSKRSTESKTPVSSAEKAVTTRPKKTEDGESSFRLPRTGFFQELVSVIFEKDYDEVTAEEIAAINALEIDFDTHEIYYQNAYTDGIDLTFDAGSDVDLSDLTCFSGLEQLTLTGRSLEEGDLDGLEYLMALDSENSLKELAQIIPCPENIRALGVCDTFSETDLADALAFPNLQYLTVEYYGLTDLSALNDMPGLRGLALTGCDRLTDFSPLMNLTGLEQLSITSPQLKALDFVGNMPNLTYLYIEGSQISDIDSIAGCPELTELYLIDNYYVMDYTVIGDLTKLTDLSLFKNTDAPVPSLEKLTALEYAAFKNLWEDELHLVTAAGNISQLYLENNYDDSHLELLTALPLTDLSLVDCSISGDHPLAFLQDLTDLVYLDLTGTYVFGNMEEVFGLPALQFLCLKEVDGVIDFDRLPANENLLFLDISGFRFHRDAWGDETWLLKDHYDMFEKYPAVEYLYAASLGIDSIDFVSCMPDLQYLNIIDNNVTSLKPLEELAHFGTVLCKGNTILENISEESEILVDTETDYYSY